MPDVGELGINFTEVGSVAQSLGVAAYERERVTREQVIEYMRSDAYDEDELWTVLGPLIDKIEDAAAGLCGMASCRHPFADHRGGEDCFLCNCTWFDTIGEPQKGGHA